MVSKILIQEIKSPFCCEAHLFALAVRGWDGKNQKLKCSPEYLREILYFADSDKEGGGILRKQVKEIVSRGPFWMTKKIWFIS